MQQNQIIKDLQNIILMNIVNCTEEVRKNAMQQFKNVKFEVLSEIDLIEMGESSTSAAFFDEDKNTIYINSMYINSTFFKHILLHEMFHAYSFNNKKTGFYYIDKVGIDKNVSNKKYICNITNKKFAMLNETATEYYAKMFSDKKAISYTRFVPVFEYLSQVCGYDNFSNLYFSNDSCKLIEVVKKSFKLNNDYLVKKLFMQMDECFNLSTGVTNKTLVPEIYKTLLEMQIQKLNAEYNKKINVEDLKSIINIDNIINIKDISDKNIKKDFCDLKSELQNYLQNYQYRDFSTKISEVKENVDNFICDRLLGNKSANYAGYKKYFTEHLVDVMLYLDQNNIYKIDNYNLHPDLPVNEFLNFMHDENKHINLSNLSNSDKQIFIKCVLNNCKHNIFNPHNHFYADDIKKDLQLS